ncbi:MAG TPA: CpsB/CapC family capsule biosynthesis tyrosine phosphatase [Thermoanaerobaculia bacterium]|nr:CpsB/CapC family capsule biosynthesis tyrosine phosphatase [Thermoanaerobaculia bacterium]
MIDIHHHCLPGVDDGPHELDEAVEMCRMAADEGIETIIATPHVLRGRWRTWPPMELAARLSELQQRITGPKLHLGSEYFFAHDMVEVLLAGKSIVPLAGGNYVLLELAANSVPPMIEQPLYRAQLEGWTPILAHPERNIVLQSRPELVSELIAQGVKMQLTAGSLLGEFGPEARRASELFLDRGMVHFLATDAHNTGKRPPRFRAATELVRERYGDARAAALTVENPRAVLENRALPYDPEPLPEPRHGFLTRVRGFFMRQRP